MLLTNWLANVTSRLRKRPVFRSRDRRALRQRWQTALSNQISTTELLEDRTLLTPFALGQSSVSIVDGASSAYVDITYQDNQGYPIVAGYSDPSAISVTGPGGPLNVVSATPLYGVNTPQLTVRYTFLAPGGSWDFSDNGSYSKYLNANKIRNSVGAYNTAASLGTFNVNLAPTDVTPPVVNTATLNGGQTSLDVAFSEPVTGADNTANYVLVRAGADGLLGSADDVAISIASASYDGGSDTATLNFAALSDDVYRLTVLDSITDVFGNSLDGDGNGSPGGDFTYDFVAGPNSTTLTSPGGKTFDPETVGFGAGQLVDGSNNAFDGLNRLQVGGTDFAPSSIGAPLSLTVQETTSTAVYNLHSSFITPSGMGTLIATESGVYQIKGELGFRQLAYNYDSQIEYRFRINGVVGESRITTFPDYTQYSYFEVNLEDTLELNAGDTVQLEVREVTGYAELRTSGYTPQHKLTLTRLDNVPGLTVQESTSTSVYNLHSSFITPSGMGALTAAESGVYQIKGELGFRQLASNYDSQIEYRFRINGVAGESRIATFPLYTQYSYYEVNLEDTLELNAGDTVQLEVREITGYAELRTSGYTPQHKLTLTRLDNVPGLTTQETTSTAVYSLHSSFITPSGMGTLTAAESGVYQIKGELSFYHRATTYDTQIEYRFRINGVAGESRIATFPRYTQYSYYELNLEDTLELNAGDTVQLEVREVTGYAELRTSGLTPQHKLTLTRFNDPSVDYQFDDGGRTVVTNTQNLSGLDVHREITVPAAGGQDFARTVDVFYNSTAAPITETVKVVGNLGSDGETVVFKTSDGDTIVEPTDAWIGTDDADGSDTPAIIHFIHGPTGLIPATVEVVGDNIVWTYDITVNAGETARLAYFTILGDTRADAEAAVNALTNSDGFTGEAGAYLTGGELDSLQNFQFNLPPEVDSTSAANVGSAEEGQTSYSFTVTYSDNAAIDVSTIDVNDVTVTGPGGSLTVISAVPDLGTNGSPRTVTYTVTPPGGAWDPTDNGNYTIALNGSEVGDDGITQLFAAANPTLSAFNVNIPFDNVGSFSGGEFTLDSSTNPNTNLSISASGGVITITDASSTLETPPGATQVDEHTISFLIGDIPGGVLNINGGTGDDTVTIDTSLAAAGIQVIYNGGAGGGFDTLEVTGSATDVEYRYDNASDGGVLLNGSGTDFITYTGLEPISSTITATNVTLNYSGTSETITVTDAGGGQTTVNSTAGEITTFNNPTGTLTINAGGGDDIVNVNSLDPAFAANIIINGEGNDDTVNLAAALTLGSGNTTINAEDVNVNGAVTTTGAVDINAGDTIVFALAGSIAAGASSIDLDAVNNVELGQISTTGDVTVTSTAGAINDANVGAINITATNAILTAGIGAGAGDALETAVSNLEANIGAGLELDNTGTLQIGGISAVVGVTVGGASVITSTDTITVLENITASGGALELQNTGGDFILNSGVTISNNAANQIDIDSAGAVTMADGSQITHSSIGLIDIDAVTNIALSSIFTLQEVQLTTTTGSITDNTAAESALVSAGSVALRAATGIGGSGAADIDLILNTLAANTTSGDVYLSEPSQTTVSTVNGLSGITAGGNIDLNIGGTLDINQKIEATGAASTINLAADGDINVTNNVITNGGAIDLLADNDLVLGATSVVDTTTAAVVTLTADADTSGGGGFTQLEGGLVDARGGDLNITADDNIEIADLRGGTVQIDTHLGAILDNTAGEAALITATGVDLEAGLSVGSSEDLDVAVATLSGRSQNGQFRVSNTGALTLGIVAANPPGVNANNGDVNITASSPLQVSGNVNVSGTGSVWLTATDSVGAGDDLTVDPGVTVSSANSGVTLRAGDNVTISPTASISTPNSDITVNVDWGNADPGVGGVANLNGLMFAPFGIGVYGDNDADQFIIDGNGGPVNDGGIVDGISSIISFFGNGGSDELILDDSGDVSGDTINITSIGPAIGHVGGIGIPGLDFNTVEDLTVYSGTDIDDITVNPNVLTTIDIVGGNPTAPTFPGDSLTYLTPPGESSTFTPDGLDGGTISATGGYQDVTFDEIEGLTFGGSIVVDGTAGDDTLTITALTSNSGTYQINGGPVINFNANTDFTFNGLNGDDTLIINNPAGGLFDPVNGINFNGGTGGETLGDTLQILGGTAATVEHQFVDNNNGSVFFNGEGTATITYTGLEPIDDTITATNRIFTFTGAAETITLSDDGGPGNGLSLIDSDLGESVNFVHPLATLTINTELSGGSGADILNIDPLDSTFTANLTVNAGTDDIINTGTVDIGAGALDLTSGQVNVNGAFTTTGSVDIEATAADITFGAAGSIDAGASEIDLTAFFNVESLNVTTTSEVRVTATGGGINDLTGNALITADRAALRVGGPGGITGIDTNVNTLATSVAGGGFTIDNTGALEIGTVDGLAGITAAASSIFLTTTGTLLVSDIVTGGAVDLRSNDTMTISDNVSASTGTLKLQNFGGDFVLNSPAQISNVGALLIDIDSAGAVNLAEGSLITSLGTGLIDIDAVNNIALANLNTSGEVQITTSAGAITDNSGSEASLITANTAALRAATGIGSAGAGDIDLAINTMAADTTAGDIYLQEPSAATVGIVDGLAGITAAGNISLVIGGLLNVNDTIEATGAASTILIDGQGDINVNSTVQTNGGSIDLLADNDLTLGVTSVVDTTSAAAVTLVADNDAAGGGGFTQTEGGVVDARGGDLDIETTDDILIADLRSVGGRVLLDSLSGSIVDNTAGETPLITADEAALETFNNIGAVGAADIDTAVNTLAATTPNGNILISNTGALTIGSVDGLVGVNSVLGFVDVSASSPLTVSSNVTGAGAVTLTATDSAVAGDDLTIDPGVTVESTGSNVVLTAGDDFTMDATSQINAATTIGIFVDPSVGDPDAVGGTVDLVGGISAPGGTTVTGGDDDDTFNILPSSTSTIAVVGGDPTLPAVPGDTLNIDLSGVTDPALVLGGAPGSGTFNFLAPDTELPVSYSSIEDVNTLAGSYHLVLDMLFSGFEDASDDTIDVGLDAGGTNLLIDINGSNFFTGNDADILSFTVLGSDDDDTLNINETAGGLPMFTTASPAGILSSNGAHLNLAAETFLEDEFNPNTYDVNDITIHYDGKNGADAINVNFITDHNAGYFSDTIDGLGSGNIGAAAVGDTDIDLGLSFGNVEGVGFSGAANGGLRVDASSTPATTGLNINDDGTPADGVSQITGNGGFTALVFDGFSDLQVVSGTGAELIDLIALDSSTTLTSVELDADDVFAADDVSNDTIRVRSTPAGVTNVSLLGGLGDDLFQIFDAGSTVDNIFAALNVDGEGGNDTLNIVDSGDVTGDTFEVTSTTVDGISSSAGTDVTYTNIDDLNVTGTDGDDTINVNLGLQEDLNTVTINGAGGDDDFILQNSTPVGVNTVLNGQAGNDEFFFDSNYVLRGFINGGGDVDTIDYTTYSNAVHVQLAGLGSLDGFQGYELNGSILGTGGGGTGFDNINDLVGSANSDTLEGPNLNNYWGITANDEGFIIAERNNLTIGRPTLPGDAVATPPEERLDFTDFQNLIGGTQDDRFDLSDGFGLTGTLDGDTGNDSLDYRDYSTGVTVDLFAGTATNIGGGLLAGTGGGDDDNSIENVFGGDGNDNITGDNDHNILGDGLGSDNLDGGGYLVGSGNGGNDVFLMEPGAGGSADVITDIHGNDTIDFRFASQGIVFDVDIINTPQDVFGGNTVELRQLQPEQPDTNPSFMENVVGSEFDDYIFIDPLSQDGNFPIDGPPVLRSADGLGGFDILDFDAKGQAVIDTGYSLTADGVGTVQYLNFEEVTPFEDNPATIVDNGDLGFSLSGDWPYHPAGTAAITTGVGYADDIHTVQSQLVDPVHYGDAAAFWEFYGLTPGVYRVSVTWPASENPFVIPQMASDAPFTVFDGSRNDITTTAVDLGTFDLNQQVAPDDFLADGALWEDLGTFTINSRTLTVMLTNLADGLITADAVRIERVSAGPEVQLTDVTDAPAPPSILVDGHPGGIDFGTTELLTDLTRTFEITNSGSAPLDISNIVIPAGFTTTLTAQSVAAGNTISFEITMDSNSFGDRSGLFSFDTNDVDEATFNLLLHGQVSNVVIIDNGDTDFSATPGFELYDTGVNRGSAGFEGDIAGAIPNQPGFIPPPAGTDTATWTFTGLADGFYRVSTTWSALYNRVTDAPYSLDGGAGTFDIDVNQTLIPSTFADNGAAWFDLNASFEVVGGTLTVTLTNDASSIPRDTFDLANGVIADAVRIEYLPTPDLEVTVDGNVVDDDTGVVDFGTTIPGIPVSKTFTVTNLSADPVDVTGLIEFPPGFSIDPASPFGTDTVPVNIPGGGSVTFTIQFDGGTTGSTFGQVSFTTGDADENPYNFTVTGAAGSATVGINDADFSSTGTWNEHIPGVVGDPEFLYTGVPYVGGSGANEASWEFDVEPGRYQIVGHWYVHPDVSPYGRAAATNAPYTIFSDATPVDTFRVSHQTSSNDILDDGTWWEYIGDPVVIDGNTLAVMLSDDADGIVYADEIRIIRVVDPVIKVEVDGGTVDDGGAVDFEDTITGAPVVKTFTVTNFGERNMALGPINVPTGFSLISGFGDTNLAPGDSTTFTLQMDASVGGSFSGMVSFGGDLAVENPFNFEVSGSAADSMIIDNGDFGYSTSGATWNREVRTFGDDTQYFQRDQDVLLGGDLPGTNTATWTFENLGAGTYQVASHWLNHSGYASNAQITIAGIEGGPITVSLDQRFYPQGFSADGSIWQELGNFQVAAGNTLTVTISDDGANGNLAADAMRLELLSPGLTAPEIDVAAGATVLTSGVSSIDLGTAFFGETLSQTFTITNTGTNTLNLGAISLPGSGEYTVSSPLGTTTLFAGQSTTFAISFNSTGAAGVVAGPVSIVTNDSDENPFTFNITAEMTDVVLIDNGDVGYSSTGSWNTLYYDARYFESDAQRLNLGQSGTATWDFTNLTAGTYTVSATWLNDTLRATNAEYNVAGVGPVVVNQQVAPNDFAADGFNWEILTAAVVVAPGGSITVTLSDNGPADGAINADAIRIQRVGPLMAAAGASSTAAPSITQSDLDSVVDAALSYWETLGLSDAQLELLQSVDFVLTDLPDAMLGGASGTTVLIDVNAAGYGWFVDGTPLDSSEFTLLDGSLLAGSGSDAFGQMDLLTVVMHELGHTLGLEDLDSDGTLMSESLDVSERRLPSADDLDDFFSGIVDGDNPLLD